MADFTSRFNELLNRFTGSDTDLAEALGVSKQTISAWKNGVRFPKRPVVRVISDFFGVSIPWLIGITDDECDVSEKQRIAFANNLNRYMKSLGIDQTAIVTALGVSTSTVSAWVTGKKYPRIDTMQRLADFLGILISDLTAEVSKTPRPLPANLRPISDLHRQRVPLIGKVAAGQPIMAETDYETFVDSPVVCDAALEVQGDSMEPIYLDGDIVYVKHRPDVGDGQIAVVLLDDEATLKYVYHDPNGLTLLSENRKYAPISAHGDEYDYIAIYGVPVGYTRIYKPDPMKKLKKGAR